MKILNDELLSKYTTIRIGGIAKTLIIPETTEELIQVIQERKPQYFIGGGSNLLIADHEFDLVVSLKSFDASIEAVGSGRFKVGASLRLQKLINTINEHGYGGIEYLYSVPGLVGGAVVMNAGRGRQYHKTISDYIVSVDVIVDGKIKTFNKDDCGFGHRDSIFKNSPYIVVSVLFEFPEMPEEETLKLKNERIALCKEKQDASKPNFGSVFMESNSILMNIAKTFQIGGKVHFSGKTRNWVINENGSFEDAMRAIHKVKRMHEILGKDCKYEIIIWN